MLDNKYTGYIELTDEQASEFYSTGKVEGLELYDNEYILIGNDIHRYNNGFTKRVDYKNIENSYEGKIKPMDAYQVMAIDSLFDRESKVKLIRGVYGSGKDYLMFNKALSLVEDGTFQKIVFIRPNVTLANVPQIGYLPNGVDEKLAWTMAPLYDKVGGEDGVEQLIKRKIMEMVPLLFIRGRSFENSIVYVTEAQNIDAEIAKVLLSRIGEGSELWLNGDNHQTDNRLFDRDNGLVKMTEKLKGNPLFSYVYLPVTHRGRVANLANLLDEDN